MDTFLEDRITVTYNLILNYEAAIDALLINGVQSYSLNTGQTQQNVTKFDLARLQEALDMLYNRYNILTARLNGGGSINVGGAWWCIKQQFRN